MLLVVDLGENRAGDLGEIACALVQSSSDQVFEVESIVVDGHGFGLTISTQVRSSNWSSVRVCDDVAE